jgi:hypothetical protein
MLQRVAAGLQARRTPIQQTPAAITDDVAYEKGLETTQRHVNSAGRRGRAV